MNTSDTEWEKEKFNELLTLVKRGHEAVINEEEIEEYYGELRTFITSLRTSRDTYWKERVSEVRRKHANEVNRILNLHSKPIAEGGLDYIKAFEEMEKYEHKLFQSLNNR